MIKSFLSLLLIVLIFLSSFGVVAYKLRDPDFLSNQARENNLYGRLSGTLPKIFEEGESEKNAGLGSADMANVITAAIDSTTFYTFFDAWLKAHVQWLTGETTDLNFTYDLTQIKSSVAVKATDRLLANYQELPLCTAAQVRVWSADEGLPKCRLPEGSTQTNDISRLLAAQTEQTLSELPDEFTSKPNPTLLTVRENVLKSVRAIQITWAITIALTLLFLLIYRRSAFLSLAFTFLLAGLVEAAFSLIAWDWVGRIIVDALPNNQNPTLPIMIDTIATIVNVLKKTLANFSIVLLGTGVAFLLLWIFYRPKPKTPSSPTA